MAQLIAGIAAAAAVVATLVAATAHIEHRISTVETKLDGLERFDLDDLKERLIRAEAMVQSVSGRLVAAERLSTTHQSATSDLAVANATRLRPPFELMNRFIPSGWMGDWQQISFKPSFRPCSRPGDTDDSCIKIGYTGGPSQWAGIYWLFPANNWGDLPGAQIQGANELTFWARGEKGTETVVFKSGGVMSPDKPHHDSFISMKTVQLSTDWREYRLQLSNEDLSSVIGGFAWIATEDENPDGLTFYLDDIRID